MKRTVLAFTLISALSGSAFAANVATTDTNNITATVAASCQWTTPFALGFGAYDPFSATAKTGTTTATFKCVKKSGTGNTDTYKVWLSKTAGSMTNTTNGDLLAYTLTQGAGGAWPIASGAAVTVTGTAGVAVGAGYTITVNGSLAAGQDVSVGNYQDTVVANINY